MDRVNEKEWIDKARRIAKSQKHRKYSRISMSGNMISYKNYYKTMKENWSPPVIDNRKLSGHYRVLSERDGKFCRCCGTGDNLTVDHIVPLSRGGGNEIGNKQLLCESCNLAKSNLMPGQNGWWPESLLDMINTRFKTIIYQNEKFIDIR